MNRRLLATLALGATAAGISCLSGGTGAPGFLATFAAAFPAGAAGNLFTDAFKDFDKAAAERWLNQFGALDKNHTIPEQLRYAHIRALRHVMAEFGRQHATPDEATRSEINAVYRLDKRLGKLCAEEQEQVRLVSFGLGPDTPEDERRIRTALLDAMPAALDTTLAARGLGKPSTEADTLASLRRGIEDAALAELRFLLNRPDPPAPADPSGSGWWTTIKGRLAPPEPGDKASLTLPPEFERVFRGEPGGRKGWFDAFILDAATRLRTNPEFRAAWQVQQQAVIKHLLTAQNQQLGRLAGEVASLAAKLTEALESLGRIERGLEMITDWLAGVDLQPGYRPLPPDQVARLPTALVVAEYGVIPFDDSAGLLGQPGDGRPDTLLGWATKGTGTCVRLYVGGGGQGKTRLALEAARRLNALAPRWRAGLFSHRALDRALDRAPGAATTPLGRLLARRGEAAVFLAVDYAETRDKQLRELAHEIANAPPGGPIRVALLARTDGWWKSFLDQLPTPEEVLFEPYPIDVSGADIPAADRPRFLAIACASFAQRLQAAVAEAGDAELAPAADWQADLAAAGRFPGGDPLTLALGAYLHVRGRPPAGGAPAKSPLAEMAEEERFHIARALRAVTGQEPARPLTSLGFHCAAALTLLWGLSPDQGEAALHELVALLAAAARLHPAGSLAADKAVGAVREALRRLYGAGREAVWPIQPDLVGEAAVGKTLRDGPGLLGGLLDAFPGDTTRVLVLLNRITRVAPGGGAVHDAESVVAPTRSALRALLAAQLRGETFAGALIAAAMADEGLIQDDARTVLQGLPDQDRALAAAAVRVAGSNQLSINAVPVRLRAFLGDAAGFETGQAAGDGLADEHALARRASALSERSNFLSVAGRREAALAAGEEAATLYRELVGRNRDAFLPDFAMALNNLGTFLSALGRREAALAAGEEAATLYRELVVRNRDAFLPDLASALNNLGGLLSALGRREAARAAGEEAVTLYRELAERNRDAFLPDLTNALNNFGVFLSALGRREAALTAGEEAVTLRRELVRRNRDAFLPDLAGALNNLGTLLSDLGRREAALATGEEAATLYRELVGRNRDAFLPDLASALNNLGGLLSALGRREAALAAGQEAATLYRELVGRNRDAFLPDFAMALNNLGSFLSDLGRREAALAAGEEAVTLRRELVGSSREAFLPDLATTLGALGTTLLAAGKADEAVESFREGATLLHPLAADQPDAFQPMHRALVAGLVRALCAAGRDGEADAVLTEAGTADEPPAQPPSPAFAKAVRLANAWVDALNRDGGDPSPDAAERALTSHLAAHESDGSLDPVRDAIADIRRQIDAKRADRADA